MNSKTEPVEIVDRFPTVPSFFTITSSGSPGSWELWRPGKPNNQFVSVRNDFVVLAGITGSSRLELQLDTEPTLHQAIRSGMDVDVQAGPGDAIFHSRMQFLSPPLGRRTTAGHGSRHGKNRTLSFRLGKRRETSS
jgi:hypothetical protein